MDEIKNSKLPLKQLAEVKTLPTEARYQGENILRPKTLEEYLGQKSVVEKLEVYMKAAKKRGEALDHVLLAGPPGLGKTTLAHIVSNEMKGKLHISSGPALERSADLAALLSQLGEGDVLFIDEIHRLPLPVEESLYPAMEDFQMQLVLGEGASAQFLNVPLPRFTLIGATTQTGKLSAPLRDRFGIPLQLEFYNPTEMQQIILRSSKILGISLNSESIHEVALRSRGTPRVANRLVLRVRDYLQAFELPGTIENVQKALAFLDVDSMGLQALDRRYLSVLIQQFDGGPAGVESLAASLNEDKSTLEETLEPFLLKVGLIQRTKSGRMATPQAYAHIGVAKMSRDS